MFYDLSLNEGELERYIINSEPELHQVEEFVNHIYDKDRLKVGVVSMHISVVCKTRNSEFFCKLFLRALRGKSYRSVSVFNDRLGKKESSIDLKLDYSDLE